MQQDRTTHVRSPTAFNLLTGTDSKQARHCETGSHVSITGLSVLSLHRDCEMQDNIYQAWEFKAMFRIHGRSRSRRNDVTAVRDKEIGSG